MLGKASTALCAALSFTVFVGCGSSPQTARRFHTADELGTVVAYEEFLHDHPRGPWADLARQRADELQRSSTATEMTKEYVPEQLSPSAVAFNSARDSTPAMPAQEQAPQSSSSNAPLDSTEPVLSPEPTPSLPAEPSATPGLVAPPAPEQAVPPPPLARQPLPEPEKGTPPDRSNHDPAPRSGRGLLIVGIPLMGAGLMQLMAAKAYCDANIYDIGQEAEVLESDRKSCVRVVALVSLGEIVVGLPMVIAGGVRHKKRKEWIEQQTMVIRMLNGLRVGVLPGGATADLSFAF